MKNFIALLSSIKKRLNIARLASIYLYSTGASVYRDWALVLGFIVIILTAVSVISVLNFYNLTHEKEEVLPSSFDSSKLPETLDSKRLDDILDFFEKRASESAEISNTTTDLVDPSL